MSSSSWLRSPWVGKVVLQDLECGSVQQCPVILASSSKSEKNKIWEWRATYKDFPTNLFHIFLFIERLILVSPSKLKRFRISILHVGTVVHSEFQAESNLFTVVVSLWDSRVFCRWHPGQIKRTSCPSLIYVVEE